MKTRNPLFGPRLPVGMTPLRLRVGYGSSPLRPLFEQKDVLYPGSMLKLSMSRAGFDRYGQRTLIHDLVAFDPIDRKEADEIFLELDKLAIQPNIREPEAVYYMALEDEPKYRALVRRLERIGKANGSVVKHELWAGRTDRPLPA